MPAPLYLALTDGVLTVNLTDATKYALRPPGWSPAVVFPDGGISEVVESIPIDIQGATPYLLRKNFATLTTLLVQAREAQVNPGVRPVRLEIGVPNGQPAKIVTAMVTGWNERIYAPEDYFHTSGTQKTIKQVVVTIARRHPLTLARYRNPNLITNSAWMTTPAWTGSPTALTFLNAITPFGGRGYHRATLAAYTTQTITSGVGSRFAVETGQQYTVTMTVAISTPNGGITKIRLVDSSNGNILISNEVVVSASAVTAANIAVGQRISVAFTSSTQAGFAAIQIVLSSTNVGLVFEFAEVCVTAGVDTSEIWHPIFSEETEPAAPALAAHPVVQVVDFILPSPARAPLDVRVIADPSDQIKANALINAQGVLIVNDGQILVRDYPGVNTSGSAPFSKPADAARFAIGGIVARYTPAGTAAVNFGQDTIIAAGGGPPFARAMTVLAAVRNNSSTTSFDFWIEASGDGASGGTPGASRRVTIAPSASPKTALAILGDMYNIRAFATFKPFVQASAASGTFDIDYFVFVEITTNTHVMTRPASVYAALPSEPSLVVASRWLDESQPEVRIDSFNAYQINVATPDDPLLWSQAGQVKTMYMTMASDLWCAVGGAGTVGYPLQIKLTRPTAYDIPE